MLTSTKHITLFKARHCREAGLSLPEAEALNYVLTHPTQEDFEKAYGYRLIAKLEKQEYIFFDGLCWNISEHGFKALERCFK
ncbi:MAG: hypothetical protein ANABAC_1329 [Anaerolineae bacterium]|nr:MAG: hypothetical protein ANABAC_1329 [Anaerolineae bacterium]